MTIKHTKFAYGEVKFNDALTCLDAIEAHLNSTDAVIANLVDKFCSGEKTDISPEYMSGLLNTLMLNTSLVRASSQQLYQHVKESQAQLNRIQSLTTLGNQHGE